MIPKMASVKTHLNSPPIEIEPADVYHANLAPTSPVKLRIATGGAGQSGLLRSLANAFISYRVKNSNIEPFTIGWHASDTSASFNYLAQNIADLSITYHAAAERIAIQQGVADRREYAWRDHWLLVGRHIVRYCVVFCFWLLIDLYLGVFTP